MKQVGQGFGRNSGHLRPAGIRCPSLDAAEPVGAEVRETTVKAWRNIATIESPEDRPGT